MSAPAPFSIAGRSPVDSIRLRWGGLGSLGLGIALFSTGGPAGVVFGLIFVFLGVATWFWTGFGTRPWGQLPQHAKVLTAIGSTVGLLCLLAFFAVAFAIFWAIQAFADSN